MLIQETDWFEKGPLQQNHLMEKLSARGHDIRVIDHEILWKSHRAEGLVSKKKRINNVMRLYAGSNITVIRPMMIRFPTLDYISLIFSRSAEISNQLKEFKPDVIVGFQILSPFIAASFAEKTGVPFIYYWTDVYHSQIPFQPYRPLGKFIEKRIIKKSTMVFSINAKLRDYTVELGAEPTATKIIKGTVDTSRFHLNFDAKSIRSQYSIDESDLVLCFVGLFHAQLDFESVLISVSKDITKKIKLLLVGEGDQQAPNKVNELAAMSKDLGIQDRIILTGRKPYNEVPKLMAAANIYILPARANEMMEHIVPIKMYEYMAMSKPVISTRLAGVMAEFGENNGVIYAESAADIVPKAIELFANDIVTELGSKARNFIEKHGWDKTTAEFEKILEGLTQKGTDDGLYGQTYR